jgi:glycosyltransferase involved in cell wall biosynthesis
MKSKKNICIVCEFSPPPGGMANQAELLASNLEKDGFTVERCKTNILFQGFLKYIEKNILIKIFIKFPILLWRIIVGVSKCEVVHVFTIPSLSFYIITTPAVIIGKFLKRRIIINYHAGFFKKFFDDNKFKFIVRFVLNSADYITTPLKYLDVEFSSVGFKITPVSNMMDSTRFHYKIRKNCKPKFLFTRHLRDVYGPDIVINAFYLIFKEYPDATLTIAGDGYMKESLKEMTKKLGLSENVTFMGYVEGDELVQYYDDADIFINGSRRDNMPISILEAFSSGLPVVSTNPMGIPHLVEQGVTGLLSDVDDIEGLFKNAIKILTEPELAYQLSLNGKAYIDTLNWMNIRGDILSIYGFDIGK